MFRRFARSQDGSALVFVTVTLPALIGFALLAVDASRVYNLHYDLQKGADAFALAAAAELDGGDDAIDRADRALEELVKNSHSLSDLQFHTLTFPGDITRRYLSGLPPDDDDPITAAYETTDPLEAQFVEVRINPTQITAIFPATFLGAASNAFETSASAVAGFNSAVCNYTPVFICNPYENPAAAGGLTLQNAVETRGGRRRLIELRSVGKDTSYFPGDFGFLASDGRNGARALAEMIASSTPRSCFSRRGVDTKPGQSSGPVKDAFNVRFGMQEPGANFNGAQYGPAANVRKGGISNGNNCPQSNKMDWRDPTNPDLDEIMGLEPDFCFADGSCPYMDGRMGDGEWQFFDKTDEFGNVTPGYWSINHGSAPYPSDWTAGNKPTRYEVYRYEIDNNMVTNQSADGETGVPPGQCGAPVTNVDRRLIYGALLDCQRLESLGYNLGGNEKGLPVRAFASFFLTEPVRKVPKGQEDENTYPYAASVFVELVDVTGHAGRGTMDDFERDDVQLYR
ncbi:TadE/TadG family type IV pilus assembly protein [Microbaculum marinisediminis]|uniref:Pilus assembly protein TadG-related protein n=1 Tax=Microbaculum marinisediminis TaxID=2931392 RepID=A0AAW5R0J7_9HYPH|nr:pilus assembly protein TadG-related protein [Microbaculum sp. A6E488]MCT8972702.1 pilus assembly protein TadG-related protein [Microbaculum sp. A6E488]